MLQRIRSIFDAYAPPGSMRARLAGGAFWSLLGAVSAQIIGAGSSIFVARILGKHGFGEYGFIQNTIATFAVLGGLALGFTAQRYTAALKKTDPARAGRVLGLSSVLGAVSGLCVALITFFFASPLATHVMVAPGLAPCLRLASPMLFFAAINGVQIGILSGLEAFKVQSLILALSAIITSVACALGAYWCGLSGALVGSLLGQIISFVMWRIVITRQCAPFGITIDYRNAWQEKSILWSFAIPATLNGMAATPFVWATNAILVNSTDGYSQMGLFNAALQWRNLLLFIPNRLDAPLLAIMTELYVSGQYQRLKGVLIKCLKLNVIVVGFAASCIAIMAPWVMSLYGKDFREGAPVLLITMATVVLMAANVVVGQLINSMGAMWLGAAFNALWAAVLVLSSLLLVPPCGAKGLALAYLIAYGVHTVVQMVYFGKSLSSKQK